MENTILKRNSIRKFQKDVVLSKAELTNILERAKLTPSGGNVQPWTVISLSGNKLVELTNILINEAKDIESKCPDIVYYPEKETDWSSKLNKRRMITGLNLYNLLNIDRKNKEIRFDMWMDNFRWFDANNVLFVFMETKMVENGPGFLMDCGAFLQSILVASNELGYQTCPQGSTTEYGKKIREFLGVSDEYSLLYSVVIGKADENALINSYSPERLAVKDFTTFIE